eukprot:9933912-Heterocapsa_arctica.AAC.1
MPPGMAATKVSLQGGGSAPLVRVRGSHKQTRGMGQPISTEAAPAHGRRQSETRGKGHPQGGQRRTARRQAEGHM